LAAGTEPQAFVGWNGSPRAAISDDDWNNEAKTYAVFFNAWMSGYSLKDYIDIASSSNPYGDGSVILNLPLGIRFNLLQNWYGLRGWNHFNIQIYGYAGITRFGYDDGY
jgi:hypothetical protein